LYQSKFYLENETFAMHEQKVAWGKVPEPVERDGTLPHQLKVFKPPTTSTQNGND
jgi:hypothetical protein